MAKLPAPKPCESCPYRRDVPSGIWATDEYERLCEYDKQTGEQPMAVFLCHQTEADSEQARLCAGWVAVHGVELLGLRISVSMGRTDPSVFDYTTSIPLWGSGTEAAEHGLRDMDDPDWDACELIAKITNKRSDIRHGR